MDIADHAIRLNNVTYTYPQASEPSLENLDLTIPSHSTIGLAGPTGRGKSTTVDVILGLLTPQKGCLSIDGLEIDLSNLRSWQKIVGYVPQNIFLSDQSVAANIAFCVDLELIDMKAVERGSRIANLHSFVTQKLQNGYATLVGERGVRLSGGQRQRIGIARAVYHSPQVLILDEATNSLDNPTEKIVMEAVNNLGESTTIIIVAHRLTTVQKCNIIYLFENGQIKDAGTYDELKATNTSFQEMIKAM